MYWEVGGHDESFVGWGGEDNEMLDRLRTRRLHDHSYLPFVHLYHPAQTNEAPNGHNGNHLKLRLRVPASERIAQLKANAPGSLAGPVASLEQGPPS